MSGCSEKTDFTLKGQISGLESDTLLVYYTVPEYKIDSIFCKKGVFEYSFTPDTLTVFSIFLNEEESLPVFAKKGQTVELKGTATNLSIKGKEENKLMGEILTLLNNTPDINHTYYADSLIRANYDSYTNIYLMDKYFVKTERPDYNHIQDLIDKQSGIIKDTPYFIDLQSKVNAFTKSGRSQVISTLHGQDRKGEELKWSTIRDKYILLDFWASWHPQSVSAQDSLVNVIKALKKEDFLICSFSLDMDKEAWLEASERDTTQWRQLCDFKGWNNPIIKTHNVNELPANFLLDRNKRIIAKDIRGKELIEKVKELIKKDKEREKAMKKRRRR